MSHDRIRIIPSDEVFHWLPERPTECHKGDFGSVAILGGSAGMAGAVLLAARAALLMGAGRVYASLLDERIAIDPGAPEIMVCSRRQALALESPGCLVVGPGLGQSVVAADSLTAALNTALPLLIDADGLNLIAHDNRLADAVRARTGATLLTPHPGEAARLLKVSSDSIQNDRSAALAELVARYRCGVVLKGAGSLVQFPDDAPWLNTTGNPGMAAPGLGDVLAGMIAALLAQGLSLGQATLLGVHLHGAAGDAAVAAGKGPIGLTAGEVIQQARRLLNRRGRPGT